MISELVRRLLAFAIAACGAAGAVAQCQPPRIPHDQMQKRADDLGKASFQLDSSAVILRLKFTDPNQPPSIETVYAGGDKRYVEMVIEEARLLRSACASIDAPASSIEFQRLKASNFGTYYEDRLKPELQLADILRFLKDSKRQSAQLDTRQMGCPFKLSFAPFQPYLPNVVNDPSKDARRAPLIEWLQSVSLRIPDRMMPTAIGQRSNVTVPCAVLDLS